MGKRVGTLAAQGSADRAPSGRVAPSAVANELLADLHRQRTEHFHLVGQLTGDGRVAVSVLAEVADRLRTEPVPEGLGVGKETATQRHHFLEQQVLKHAIAHLRVMTRSAADRQQLEPEQSRSDPGVMAREEESALLRLGHSLAQLPLEPRVVLTLVVGMGRSLNEVATLLRVGEATCHVWITQGRKLLRRALQTELVKGSGQSGDELPIVRPGTLHDLHGNKKEAATA